MKIFISYNFLSSDKNILKEKLQDLSSALESLGHTTFIHWRDKQDWGENGIEYSKAEIITNAFKGVEECEYFIAFTETKEKSQGMLLELGYAFAKNKKVVLASVNDPGLQYVQAIAEKVIVSDNFERMVYEIKGYFKNPANLNL